MKTENLTYTFNNYDLQKSIAEIIEKYKETGILPTTDQYINDADSETGEEMYGYAIDYNEIDRSFLYNSRYEWKEDYKNLMQALDLIAQLD